MLFINVLISKIKMTYIYILLQIYWIFNIIKIKNT